MLSFTSNFLFHKPDLSSFTMLTSSFIAFISAAVGFAAPTQDKRINTADSLQLYVRSSNPATNNRRLVLRPYLYDEAFGHPNGTTHYVGVDDTSPELMANMSSGTLFSTSQATFRHAAYLNLRTSFPDQAQTEQYLMFFANFTEVPNAADTDWTLQDGQVLNLRHNQPVNTTASFALCKADFNLDFGPWYDLTYVWSNGAAVPLDDCEFVEISSARA